MKIIILLSLIDLINSSEALEIPTNSSGFENGTNHDSERRCLICPADVILFCLSYSGSKFETKFIFYSKSNRRPEVKYENSDLSHLKNFDAKLPTKVIIHGYSAVSIGNEAYSELNMKLANSYLDHHNVNVVVVDWTAGSSDINYCVSKSRVPIVGKVIATFLDKLLRSASKQLWDQLTIVGFSLGGAQKDANL